MIDLGIYDIRYSPRIAKKQQVLADFLVEMQSFAPNPEHVLMTEEEFQIWVHNIDEVLNVASSGIRIVLEASSGLQLEALRLDFQATNNEVEYEALIHGSELAKQIGVSKSWSEVTPN